MDESPATPVPQATEVKEKRSRKWPWSATCAALFLLVPIAATWLLMTLARQSLLGSLLALALLFLIVPMGWVASMLASIVSLVIGERPRGVGAFLLLVGGGGGLWLWYQL